MRLPKIEEIEIERKKFNPQCSTFNRNVSLNWIYGISFVVAFVHFFPCVPLHIELN